MASIEIHTIGHSIHPIEYFTSILKSSFIDAIADVRSSPYSKFTPQYNRENLYVSLKDAGISYVFLGDKLGARPKDDSCYENGQVKYNLLAKTDNFKSGISRLIKGSEKYSIAIMCSEKEPIVCHRTLLVGRELFKSGISVKHIGADGSIETHSEAMARLMRLVNVSDCELFRSREELLEIACSIQESKTSYRKS